MKGIISKLYDKKIDASGLAIFRVVYAAVLFAEIGNLFFFRHLVFDPIPFIEFYEINSFAIPLLVWMGVVLLLMIGLFTRIAAIINYLFSLLFLASISSYEYHMFYVYMGINFLLIFTETARVGSIDSLLQKLSYSTGRFSYSPSGKVSVLNYYLLVLVAIGFVYFDSVLFKVVSPMWLKGLGVWLPASLPQITQRDLSFFLNQKWLMLLLGYVTLGFEAIFIFTFFRRSWRIPLLVVGTGLHLGIFIAFPIPLFALGMISVYTLLVPVACWRRLKVKCKTGTRLTFYCDDRFRDAYKTKIMLNHWDFCNAIECKDLQSAAFPTKKIQDWPKGTFAITKKGKVRSGMDAYRAAFLRMPLLFPLGVVMSLPPISIFTKCVYRKLVAHQSPESETTDTDNFTAPVIPQNQDEKKILHIISRKELKVRLISLGISILLLCQLNITFNSGLALYIFSQTGLDNSSVGKKIIPGSRVLGVLPRVLWGITNHAIFIDDHFRSYNHLIAICMVHENGEREFLPYLDPKGIPDAWNHSFTWAKYTWRMNAPLLDPQHLADGVRDFTAFWAHKKRKDLSQVTFEILVKKIDIPTEWEKDFLTHQLEKPWINGGYVVWQDSRFQSHLLDIETL